jgi:hypothetical protein
MPGMNMSRIIFFVLIVSLTISCGKKARYDRMVKRELASGERYDSLFFGIYLGMASKDFFTHCWKLNKEGLIRQGQHNLSVEHDFEELKHSAKMNFYPNFHEEKIFEMPVRFQYTGWSPWSKHMWSDSLQVDVLNTLEDWYGEGFMEVEHPKHGSAFVKVDGNRRITLFKKGIEEVYVIFTDLSVESSIDKQATLQEDDTLATE